MIPFPLRNEEIIKEEDQRSFVEEISFKLDLDVMENSHILRWRSKIFQVKRTKGGKKIKSM